MTYQQIFLCTRTCKCRVSVFLFFFWKSTTEISWLRRMRAKNYHWPYSTHFKVKKKRGKTLISQDHAFDATIRIFQIQLL